MPPETAGRPRILALDDSPLQQALLRRELEALGCEFLPAASLARAEALIAEARPGLILVELLREQGNGFEDGRALMEKHAIPGVLMSASGRSTDAPWAARLGFANTLRRPFTRAELGRALRAAGLSCAGS